jgi:membrane protease YdiL (CAAX protease family)
MESGNSAYDPTEQSALSSPPPGPSPLFFNEHGLLRAGWRLLVYLLLVLVGGAILMMGLRLLLTPKRGVPTEMIVLAEEVVGFALVYGAAVVMSRLERLPVSAYGLPMSEALGSKFWLGFLFGLLEVSLLVGLIAAFGGYSVGSLALQGSEIMQWGLFHLLLFFFVGLFEEFLFRGYMQYTLAEGIGFWPAAILLSVVFGGVHLGNPGEGWVGGAGVVMVAIFFCFTLKRTGNLWYAVGLHASFDWGETYLYSVPNSGTTMEGSLSHAVLHGPKWLTGGTVGPEGSVFCFLTIALQFLVIMWLFPKKNAANPQSQN